MKKLIQSVFISLFISFSLANADEISHRASAEELLKLMKIDQMMKPMFQQMEDMMEMQFEQMGVPAKERPLLTKYTDKLLKILEEQLGWEKMKDDFITVYAETYTEDEIRAISAFYKSSAGQKFVEKMPLLMQKSMEISQKNMPDIINKMQQIQVEMFTEMMAEINKKKAQGKNQTQPKNL